MSIQLSEAEGLIDIINNSNDLTQNGLPAMAASLIRRSLYTTVKNLTAQKNLLIIYVDFSKPTMIISLPSEKREKDYKKTLFCIARIEPDFEEKDIDETIGQISTSCFQNNLYGHPLLIFLFKQTDEQRHLLQEKFKDSYVSDINGMKDLLVAKDPSIRAQSILKDSDQSVDGCMFSYLGPCHPNMFFGRKKIIRNLLFDSQKGHAITGGRRIGKTSLLFKLRYEIENKRYPDLNYHVVYIDCSTFSNFQELIAEITRKLLPKYYYQKGSFYSFTFLETLDRATHLKNKIIILLLDEMDNLVFRAKEQQGFGGKIFGRFFTSLRAAANEEFVRLVISGFRQVSRLITNNDLELFNLCEGITLGILNTQEVHDLITLPFMSAGIELDNKNAFISTIMDMTSGHPSFVQFIAKKLFKERKGSRILLKELKKLHQNRSLINYILDHFTMNTSPFERLICLSMIDYPSFTYQDIADSISNYGIYQQNFSEEIHSAQKNLAMNSILTANGERFQFLNKLIMKTIITNYPPKTYIPILIKECLNEQK